MGFKEFLKKANEIADEPYESKFDESLSGVHIYDKKRICEGFRFYDGKLIDFQGNLLRKYDYGYLGCFSNDYYFGQDKYEGKYWGCFKKNGTLVWKKKQTIHHEIFPTKRNTVYVLDKENHKYKNRDVGFDVILEYDIDGNEIWRWSFWENFVKLKKFHKKFTLDFFQIPFLPDFAKRKERSPWGCYYDYYHANSVFEIGENVLGEEDVRFKIGNLLVSSRHGSLIFVIEKETGDVVWICDQFSVKEQIQGQHCPQLLENGNILLFDNGRYRNWSRIIEFNPINFEIEFEYRDENFFTLSQGYVQKLNNGNYLVTESEKGRVFEITKDKEIVWEYFEPEVQSKKNSSFEESWGRRMWIYRMINYHKLSL